MAGPLNGVGWTDWAEAAAGGGDAGGVEAEVGQQFAALAVFDEVVGNAEPADAAGVDAGFATRLPAPRVPKPPISAASSTVTTKPHSRTARRIVSASSGLTKRALMTPTSRALRRASWSAASTHVGKQRAAADDHAVVAPARALRSCRVRRARVRRRSFRRSPWDSESRTGPSCRSARSSICGTSASSPGAITTRFGKTRR